MDVAGTVVLRSPQGKEVWLFRRQSDFQALAAAFSKFMSKDELRKISENTKTLPALKGETIHYVLLQVRDDTPEMVQRYLSSAIGSVVNDGGMVEGIMSSLVSGIFEPASHPPEWSMADLLTRLGPDARAVFGQGEYLRGGLGSERRFTCGTIFPKFDKMPEALFRLEFGSSSELSLTP